MEKVEQKNFVFDSIIDGFQHFFNVYTIIITILLIIILYLCRYSLYSFLDKLRDLARKRIRNHFIRKSFKLVIKLFSSTFFTVFITVICPYLINHYNSQINIIVAIWIMSVFLNAFCSNYSKNNQRLHKWSSIAISEFNKIQINTANKIFNSRKNLPIIIEHVAKNGGISTDCVPYYFNYEHAAEIACESIYHIIKDITGYQEHLVTVYKRYQNKTGKSCPRSCPLVNSCGKSNAKAEWTKMVACYNKLGATSLSFDQEHCFEYCENKQIDSSTVEKKQHFYIHFFKQNQVEVEIITGKKQIAKKFLFHKSTKTREENIEQYIGIPMSCAESKTDDICADISNDIRDQQHLTYAVVQIDFCDKGILGRNEKQIKVFISNILGCVISYLDSSLQMEGMNNQLFECISDFALLNTESYNELKDEYIDLEKRHNQLINQYKTLCKEISALIPKGT